MGRRDYMSASAWTLDAIHLMAPEGVVGSILACYSLDIFEILYWNCTVHLPTVFVVVPTSCQWGGATHCLDIPIPGHTHPLKGPRTRNTRPQVDRMTDRCLWKHCLPTTLLEGVNCHNTLHGLSLSTNQLFVFICDLADLWNSFEVSINNTILTKFTYLTCLSILCFNLGEIVSSVWHTSFF